MVKRILNLGLCVLVLACFTSPIVLGQNLTDQVVTEAAIKLVNNQIVDGLSIGYIEGENYGIVHLGASSSTGKPASNLTIMN